MAGLRLVAAVAIVAAFGVFTIPASGDPVPPVQVATNQFESLGVPRGYEFDPAVQYEPFEYSTCVQLLNYPDLAAPAGWQLQPEAAVAMPAISPDGLTYTFTIRPGLGFSPPSTEQVTAGSFLLAIERFEKLQSNGYQTLLDAIAGAADYRAGTASSISGLAVSGSQLTITLTQPDQTLAAKLALPLFCAVPSGTSLTAASDPLPSAGPYYVDPASVTRDGAGALTGFTLLRNPNYGGSRPATLPELDYSVQPADEPFAPFYSAALAGAQASPPTTDWVNNLVPAGDRASLDAGYGPGSGAAGAGQQQYYSSGAVGTQFLFLNNYQPGLNDARVRQAINDAVDRTAMAGFFFADPTDQVTPISFPGFVDYQLYPFTSNIGAAQALMQQAGYGPTNRLSFTVLVQNGNQPRLNAMNDVKTRLADVYIDLTIATMPAGQLFGLISDPSRSAEWDMATIAWLPDYLDGSDVVGTLLDSRQPGNADWSHFTATAAEYAQFDYAASLDPGSARDLAWVNLDRDLMANDAPLVPFAGFALADFFSTRVGCQVYQPIYGIDVGRLCERVSIAAGGTYSTAPASASTPIQTTITSPNAGSVAVTTGATATDVSGYDLLGSEVSIEAPLATSASPLTLTFVLDPSLLGGATAGTVTVLRNGTAVPDCTAADGTATPDPCVSGRSTDANGDAVLTVLTSEASTWSFGVRDTAAPVVESVALSANPVTPGTAVTLSVGASPDAVAADFYVDHDNGPGLNLPLEGGAGSFTTPPFGSTLAVGAHALGIRVRDAAHNWSPVRTVYLVVSDHPATWVTAGGSLDTTDGKAAIAFQARYREPGATAPDGGLTFASRGFVLASRSLEWLVAGADSVQLQGTGRIAGSDGAVRFRVSATVSGHVELRVWPAAADPDTAPPLYQATGDLRGGNVVLHG